MEVRNARQLSAGLPGVVTQVLPESNGYVVHLFVRHLVLRQHLRYNSRKTHARFDARVTDLHQYLSTAGNHSTGRVAAP